MKTKKLTFLALCACIALILSYIESLLPPIFSAVPGIKVGLPNIMIIFTLYRYGLCAAGAVSMIRICLSALLFGNVWSLAYSICGGTLSLFLMFLLKKTERFSYVGVSVVGGISHNLGQILLAMVALKTREIGFYMIVLSFSGIIAGIFVGLASALMLKYVKKV